VLSHEPSKGVNKNHQIGRVAKPVDDLLELSVAGSFSRVGYLIRDNLEGWNDPSRLDGKTTIVTGASSGIGQAVAVQLAALGANVWLVGRNRDRLRFASKVAESAGGGGRIHTAEVDVVNAPAVSAFVDRVTSVCHVQTGGD
jgi:shikimate 5-dehydrogenase